MKRLKGFLRVIQALPEEARKLIAGLSFVISVLVIVGLWNITIPYRLETVGETDTAPTLATAGEVVSPENEALTPAAGIVESLRATRNLFPKINSKKLEEEFGAVSKNLETRANSALNKMANFLFYTNIN